VAERDADREWKLRLSVPRAMRVTCLPWLPLPLPLLRAPLCVRSPAQSACLSASLSIMPPLRVLIVLCMRVVRLQRAGRGGEACGEGRGR
jgi:hypothetical protein